MATTSDVKVTPGTGSNVGTYSISEDAETKQIQRVALNESDGTDTAIAAKVGSLTETAPASDTASSGLNGRLQRIAQRLTSLIALFPSAIGRQTTTGSLSVTLSSDHANVPVSQGVIPWTVDTPAANLDAKLGSLTESAPASDTASSGLNGRLQRIAQRLTSLIALLPTSLGAGGGLKIDGSGTSLPITQKASTSSSVTMQNAAVATGNGTTLSVDGMSAVVFTVSGTFVGTVTFEGTEDNTNYSALSATQLGTNTIGTTATAAGTFEASVAGLQTVRARISAYTSGSITVTAHTVPVNFATRVVNANIVSNSGTQGVNITQVNGSAVTTAATGIMTVGLVGGAGQTISANTNAAAPSGEVVVGGTYNSAPSAITSGNSSQLQLDSKGNLRNVVMDAAGNARGANVDASNRLSVTVDNVSATNISTNVAQMNGVAVTMGNGVSGTGVQRVAIASDNTVLPGVGAGATGSAVPANASYGGAIAKTALPSAGTDANLVGVMADKFGRQIIIPGTIRDLVGTQTTTISASTSETTVVTAGGSGVFNDLELLVVSNTSATAARVDFRDATAGSVLFSLYVPAGDTRGFSVGMPIPQTTANNNWTAQSSASVTDLRVYAVFHKNK